MIKTGKKIYTQLIERYIDNGKPTGLKKINSSNDVDYVAPVTDYIMCPTPEILNSFEDTTSIPNIYTLIVDANINGGNFTIQPVQDGGQYLENSTVTISASSNVGFTLESFSGSEGIVSGNSFTFIMNANKNILINFQPDDVKIIAAAGGSVRFEVNDSQEPILFGGQSVYYPYGSLIRILGSEQGELVCQQDCAFIDGDSTKILLDGEYVENGYGFILTESVVMKSALYCNTNNCNF